MPEISYASHHGAHDMYSSCLLLQMTLDEDDFPNFLKNVSAPHAGVLYPKVSLTLATPMNEVFCKLIGAALWQFYINLLKLCESEEPELVHQARIGWRRFRGTCRLLRTVKELPEPPATGPMQVILEQLRALREIHVTRYEILPRINANNKDFSSLSQALEAEAHVRLDVLRHLLQDAYIGNHLWQHAVWLMQLKERSYPKPSRAFVSQSRAPWIKKQVAKIHQAFEHAKANRTNATSQHRARIWAKRLRYAVDDFEGLLPHTANKWRADATQTQDKFGKQRDLQMAAILAERHGAKHIARQIRSLVKE